MQKTFYEIYLNLLLAIFDIFFVLHIVKQRYKLKVTL